MSDQKYRQHGYMDRERGTNQENRPKPRPKEETFGPRAMNMPGTRTVSRCTQCGVVLRGADGSGKCPQCDFELHSCKQCAHFDPGERNECRKPIPERIQRKDQRNECTFYAIKTAVERETTTGYAVPAPRADSPSRNTGPSSSAQDARRAFENLFKK